MVILSDSDNIVPSFVELKREPSLPELLQAAESRVVAALLPPTTITMKSQPPGPMPLVMPSLLAPPLLEESLSKYF